MNGNFNEEIDLGSLRNSKMKTKVYNVIMKEILSGQYQPGDKILIKENAVPTVRSSDHYVV